MARPRRSRGPRPRPRRLGVAVARSVAARTSRRSSTAATRGRATSSRWRRSTTSRPSTGAATATHGRGCPIEVVAIRPGPAARRPRPDRAARPGPSAHRWTAGSRTGLHGLGPRRLGGRARPAPGAAVGPERCRERLAPAGVAGPDLAVDRGRRGDGRGPAARRVQPEHQGARGLLGGVVHRGRRAARPGRAHPGAPRLDAGGGPRGDRCAWRRPAGRPDHLNDPYVGGTHLNDVTLVAPCFVADGLVGGRRTGPTMRISVAWRRARCHRTRCTSRRRASGSRRSC